AVSVTAREPRRVTGDAVYGGGPEPVSARFPITL
ncbi:MAG: hypothetical protein QOE59_2435, partial [Actinomycetota bacterium]|nr:hypothetical protein [Actinomycetota bacterium]